MVQRIKYEFLFREFESGKNFINNIPFINYATVKTNIKNFSILREYQ